MALGEPRHHGVVGVDHVGDPRRAESRPTEHWDATFEETLSNGTSRTWALHLGKSFTDVATSNPFYASIEALLHSGVTGGCTTGAEAASGVPGTARDGV